jgi:hypothetical protein
MTAHDWDAIEREYRAGQLSIKELARQHKLSDTAIHKRAKPRAGPGTSRARSAHGFAKACFCEGVRANLIAGSKPSDADIIDEVAAIGVAVFYEGSRKHAGLPKDATSHQGCGA